VHQIPTANALQRVSAPRPNAHHTAPVTGQGHQDCRDADHHHAIFSEVLFIRIVWLVARRECRVEGLVVVPSKTCARAS
jgi:hypothetical protein